MCFHVREAECGDDCIEDEGVGEGGKARVDDVGEVVVDEFWETTVPGDRGECFAHDVEEEGMESVELEELAPCLFALDVDDVGEEGKHICGYGTGGEGVGWRPDAFVEWILVGDEVAYDDEYGGEDKEVDKAGVEVLVFVCYHSAYDDSEEGVGKGGDGAEQSFRVDRTLVVEVCFGQVEAVEDGCNVCAVLCVTIAECEDEGINDEKGCCNLPDVLWLHP